MLEKAREAGAHMLSGAVLDPSTLRDLIPDFQSQGRAARVAECQRDHVYFLTERSKIAVPDRSAAAQEPRQLHHLAQRASCGGWRSRSEAEGIDFFTGFAGQDVLMDGARVVGVRTGDRGVGKHGEHKADVRAGRGHPGQGHDLLRRRARQPDQDAARAARLGKDREPEQFAVGLKELWEIPPDRIAPGTVIHTMGYPAAARGVRRRVHLRACPRVGCRSGSSPASTTTIRCSIRTWRSTASSSIRSSPRCSRAGTMVRYGAKALPEGGWNTIPRTYMAGG